MAANVPMYAVLDGSDTRVGMARWKGSRLYLIESDPTITVATGGLKLTLTKSEWDSLSHHMEGPHVHWMLTPDIELKDPRDQQLLHPWPGLSVRVMKDHYQVGCVIELDSKTRTYTQLGLVHMAVPEDEWYDRVTPTDPDDNDPDHYLLGDAAFWYGERFIVDGKPWNPREHLVTGRYDSVSIFGYMRAMNLYRDRIPKHWSVVSTFEVPDKERSDAIVQGALDDANEPCDCVEVNKGVEDPTQRRGCSYCDNHHVEHFNALHALYIKESVQLDAILAVFGRKDSITAAEIVETHRQRTQLSPEAPANLRFPPRPTEEYPRDLVAKGAITEDTVETILTEPRCPTCGIGIDSDGDGDCVVCAKGGPWNTLAERQKALIAEQQKRHPRLANCYDSLEHRSDETQQALARMEQAMPIFELALGDYCTDPHISGYGKVRMRFRGPKTDPGGTVGDEEDMDQEVFHIEDDLVKRLAPADEKGLAQQSPRRDTTYRHDDWTEALAYELALLKTVLDDPQSPWLADLPVPTSRTSAL